MSNPTTPNPRPVGPHSDACGRNQSEQLMLDNGWLPADKIVWCEECAQKDASHFALMEQGHSLIGKRMSKYFRDDED